MISEELISKPEALDSTGDRCILVIKNGTSTGVTIGRATGIQSFVRDDDTGEVSREWAIYNYDSKSGVFSAPGDSGSILVALDALVGCFYGGVGKTDTCDVTYITPMWWLWPRIKAQFPLPHHCHCLGTTQTWLAYPILSSCPTAFFLDHLYTIYSLTLPSTCLSVELRMGNTI